MYIEIDDEGRKFEYRKECPETTEELIELLAASEANTLIRFRRLINDVNDYPFIEEPIQIIRVTRLGMTDFLFTKKPNTSIVKTTINELKMLLSLLQADHDN